MKAIKPILIGIIALGLIVPVLCSGPEVSLMLQNSSLEIEGKLLILLGTFGSLKGALAGAFLGAGAACAKK